MWQCSCFLCTWLLGGEKEFERNIYMEAAKSWLQPLCVGTIRETTSSLLWGIKTRHINKLNSIPGLF
jgi:hypothetical protein